MARRRAAALRTAWLWGPAAVYAAAIFIASSVSEPPMPDAVSDRTLHAWLYGGLALLVLRALTGGRRANLTAGTAAAAVLGSAAYGLSDEIHQRFVPGRVFDVRDLLADAIGAAAAVALAYAVERLRRLRSGDRSTRRHAAPRSTHDDVPSANLP